MADDANVARLVVSLEAKIDQFEKKMASSVKGAYGAAAEHQKAAKKIEDAWGSIDPEKGLMKIFDSSRLKVLDSGIARVGLFGSGLEALGPIGLTAAAGIVAFAAVMDRAGKAAEFAESLQHQAELLGINVERVQELNHAFVASGIDIAVGDEALGKLNATLGQLQAGLALGRVKKTWAALGFDQEGLKQFHDAGDLLPVLADRLKNAGDAAEQAAIAKRLGITELLPLLRQGSDAVNGLAKEAHDLGIVMDASMVKQGAEASIKLKEFDEIMKTKTNVTFVEFADTLVSIKLKFIEAMSAGLHFLAIGTGTLSSSTKLKDVQNEIQELYRQHPNGQAFSPESQRLLDALVIQRRALIAAQDMADSFAAATPPPGAGGNARNLVPSTAGKDKGIKLSPFDKVDLSPFSSEATYDASDQGHHLYLQPVTMDLFNAASKTSEQLTEWHNEVEARTQLVDPCEQGFASPGLAVTSVPYFDERCGLRFKGETVATDFGNFWDRLRGYRPRDYILETLTPGQCAERYLTIYDRVAAEAASAI